MSEERNSGYGRRQERRDRRMKERMEQQQSHYARRESKLHEIHSGHGHYCHKDAHDHKEWLGIFIILIGLIWLTKELWGPYPDWFFSWESILIAFGLALGISSRFRHKGAIILILIGLAFFTRDFIFPNKDLGQYIWPIIIIGIGILFLIKRKAAKKFRKYAKEHPDDVKNWKDCWYQSKPFEQATDLPVDKAGTESTETQSGQPPHTSSSEQPPKAASRSYPDTVAENDPLSGKKDDMEDWLDVNTIFSGTKRNVLSKNLKGGQILNIFGGTEIDMSRADIEGNAILDLTNIMGGISLAIPPNWQLKFNCTCIMGGTDDHRRTNMRHDSNKTLTLTGTVLMAGVEIKDVL